MSSHCVQHHTNADLENKFILMPQAKAAVVNELEKLEKILAIQQDERYESSFCVTDGHLSFKEC